ncbi:hypothetical protein PENSPDRAFT_653123 [Peniophora sp. CONT]|nr:hypothetical protein PENSPDRAFT_653123 [Peniophora sp. CONT]
MPEAEMDEDGRPIFWVQHPEDPERSILHIFWASWAINEASGWVDKIISEIRSSGRHYFKNITQEELDKVSADTIREAIKTAFNGWRQARSLTPDGKACIRRLNAKQRV